MNMHYQLAVIGSGSGGSEAALVAARNGLRVVLIEKETLGGTCLHRGFYSLKALHACAEAAKDKAKNSKFGLEVSDLENRLADLINVQKRVSARLTQKINNQLERAGVELRFGRASLAGAGKISLKTSHAGTELVEADYIILATGSRPGLDSHVPNSWLVNSDELLMRSGFPRHLMVVGGGYVGCEFASIFRSLGSEVTLVEKRQRLLPEWDESVGDFIAECLRSSGVDLHLGFEIDIARHQGTSEEAQFVLADQRQITPDLVLAATGRKPNVEDLGLEMMGIRATPFISVDEQMRTSCNSVLAVGDVNGLGLLDSAAVAQALVAVDTILGKNTRFSSLWIPRCIHTDPPVASIGWNEDEAGRAGLDVIAHSQTFRLVTDDERTVVEPAPVMLKILVQAESRQILGVHAIGRQAAELVNFASVAIRSDLTLEQLVRVPLVHPSTAEAIQECAKGLGMVEVG
jgi:dihydrolipoamide dehydrogenase